MRKMLAIQGSSKMVVFTLGKCLQPMASVSEQLHFRIKQLKFEHNKVDNPNWQDANPLVLIYKHYQEAEFGLTVKCFFK